MSEVLRVPKKLVEEIRRRGFDPEARIAELLLRDLNLDPNEEIEVHIELAERFLEEGRQLIDKDPVQASENLYKAAEEAVKALTIAANLEGILTEVERRGRWRADDLFNAVNELAKRVGKDVKRWWHTAWTLHVHGFHEAKLPSSYLRDTTEDIENLVKLALKQVNTQK